MTNEPPLLAGYKVHPMLHAAIPMMTEDELADLADDIGKHGQINLITLDQQKRVVDGRCRLIACGTANVAPQFVTKRFVDEDDILEFIADMNIWRANYTISQRAMQAVMMEEKSGVLQTSRTLPLDDARRVLRADRAMAESVIKGYPPLATALMQVEKRQQEVEAEKLRKAAYREQNRTMAELVDTHQISLDDAIKLNEARKRHNTKVNGLLRQLSEAMAGSPALSTPLMLPAPRRKLVRTKATRQTDGTRE